MSVADISVALVSVVYSPVSWVTDEEEDTEDVDNCFQHMSSADDERVVGGGGCSCDVVGTCCSYMSKTDPTATRESDMDPDEDKGHIRRPRQGTPTPTTWRYAPTHNFEDVYESTKCSRGVCRAAICLTRRGTPTPTRTRVGGGGGGFTQSIPEHSRGTAVRDTNTYFWRLFKKYKNIHNVCAAVKICLASTHLLSGPQRPGVGRRHS